MPKFNNHAYLYHIYEIGLTKSEKFVIITMTVTCLLQITNIYI